MPSYLNYALRPLKLADAELIRGWRNSDRVRANMYTDAYIAESEHLAWLERTLKRDDAVYLVFEFMGKPFGLVYFTEIDREAGRCDLGFYLGDAPMPPGLGGILEFFALEYAFDRLGIRKLCAEVLAFNEAVLRVHKHFQLNQEGVLVEHVMKNGELTDVILFSMFASQWPSIEQRMKKLLFR
jgi:UDP-4-amino-4,6-dideoxy-N-acetyl-beta-L-altrosamine N-acetyltransferase